VPLIAPFFLFCRFESLQNMHRRWQEYAHGLVHPAQTLKEAAAAALSADLHGALLRVSEAPEARLVGVRGIVVRDTAGAFFLVTPEDRVVTVPKAPGFAFELTLGGRQVVTLLGSGLAETAKRAVATSGKKKRGKR
jgi:RNase P/RNase MRP subunit p29